MQGAVADRVARPDLHDLAEVHHRHPVADVAHDREVVRDEKERQLELLLQVLHQVDDLRLDGDVERGHRFVGHDEGGVQHQRASDADALPLSSGELVRVAVDEVRVQANDPHDLLHLLLRLAPTRDSKVAQRLGDDVAHRHARVQGRVGVLEDHLDLLAHPAQLLATQLGHVHVPEEHAARRGGLEPNDDPAQRRLSAAGLADEAQRLALPDHQVHAVHRMHDRPAQQATPGREVLDQLLDANKRTLDRRVGARWRLRGRLGLAHFWAMDSGSLMFFIKTQHRASCPGSTSASGGSSVRQRSMRNRQRG